MLTGRNLLFKIISMKNWGLYVTYARSLTRSDNNKEQQQQQNLKTIMMSNFPKNVLENSFQTSKPNQPIGLSKI